MSGTGSNADLPGPFETLACASCIYEAFSLHQTEPLDDYEQKNRSFATLITPAMENSMIHLDLSTHIYRPLTQVFSFVATPENDFQWQYGTLDSIQISRGEMGVGTLFHVTGNFLGQRIESTYEVTEFVPNQSYGFQSRSGPLESHTLYTFEISKATTKLSMSARVSIGELFKPGDCTVEKKIKKQYRENLALLKGVLEADRIEKR